MKKSILSLFASLIFLAAVSFAQSSPSSYPSQGSSPSSQQEPSMGQGSAASSQAPEAKSDKKIKGCIRSQGGQYVLEDKHGKTTPLSGQDLSAHVGHEVTVHGTWASSSAPSDSSTTSGGGMGSTSKSFTVATVDMVSETCSLDKSKSSDSMQK